MANSVYRVQQKPLEPLEKVGGMDMEGLEFAKKNLRKWVFVLWWPAKTYTPEN